MDRTAPNSLHVMFSPPLYANFSCLTHPRRVRLGYFCYIFYNAQGEILPNPRYKAEFVMVKDEGIENFEDFQSFVKEFSEELPINTDYPGDTKVEKTLGKSPSEKGLS